jgi:cytochrome c2
VKTTPAGEITDPGKKLFVDKGCQDCHKVKGTGGEIGPDLTGIGSSRDKTWLDSWLKSPTSVKRGASMPAPGLTDEERTRLVEFLSSQK